MASIGAALGDRVSIGGFGRWEGLKIGGGRQVAWTRRGGGEERRSEIGRKGVMSE